MAAMALQQVGAGRQGRIHGEAPRGAHGGPQAAAAFAGEQGHRPVEAFHQPGRHDADHAVVPVGLGQQQEGGPPGSIGLEQGQGLGFDRGAEVAALAVEGIAAAGQFERPLGILGGEQLHHKQGIPKAAHGIDPGRQLETHRLRIHPVVLQAGDPLQGPQALQPGAGQPGEAIEQPAAVDPQQRGHVGDGADAEEVEGDRLAVASSQPAAQGRGQHVGQAHSGQPPEGGAGGGDRRMEQGQMGRQLRRQGVVVRQDHLHLQGLGPLQRLPRRHAVVDRDQQGDAVGRQPLDHGGVEAIAVLLPAWDGGPRPGAEPLQNPHQQGRACHAVGVIVAADRHRLARAAGLFKPRHGGAEVGEVVGRIGGCGGIQQGFEGGGFAVAPPAEHRQQLRRQGLHRLWLNGLWLNSPWLRWQRLQRDCVRCVSRGGFGRGVLRPTAARAVTPVAVGAVPRPRARGQGSRQQPWSLGIRGQGTGFWESPHCAAGPAATTPLA